MSKRERSIAEEILSLIFAQTPRLKGENREERTIIIINIPIYMYTYEQRELMIMFFAALIREINFFS